MLCQVPSRNTSCVICAGKVYIKPIGISIRHICISSLFFSMQERMLYCQLPNLLKHFSFHGYSRDQSTALTAKELDFVPSGWMNLLFPNSR